MEILKSERILCPCCMVEHEVKTVRLMEENIFKDEPVEYVVEYQFCERTGDFFEEEDQLEQNFLAMKNAYREKVGLLTTEQISEIRGKYGITQRNLSLLLGWGTKMIKRYEECQVQDSAHDMILHKLDSSPDWFLQLLEAGKERLSETAYKKCLANGMALLEDGA